MKMTDEEFEQLIRPGKCYGSMPPSPCTSCSKCKTNLAIHPKFCGDPIPHEFITKYNENTGQPYKTCRVCWRTEKELTEEEGNTSPA